MATVREIAKRLGVSTATVSRSLNDSSEVSDELKSKVVSEAKRIGYRLPRSKRLVRPMTIGIAFLNRTSGPKFMGYDAAVWGGVARGASQYKAEVMLVEIDPQASQAELDRVMKYRGLDGLVLRVDAEAKYMVERLADYDLPIVVLADHGDVDGVSYVYCDAKPPCQMVVEHLIHLGHKRIGLCHNHVMDTDHRDRIEAYMSALKESGIGYDPELIVPATVDLNGGARAMNRFLSLPNPPTAMFVIDPVLVVGVFRRAHEIGLKIPEEMSIVGIDDDMLRQVTFPSYTAVCQNAPEVGFQAGVALCKRLQHQIADESFTIKLDAFLEINESTAPPPVESVRATPQGQRILV
ncbi:putative HTH-type transcriptional repressor ExuR [Poriferisphaera corsica]|uniref:Putative HTH-type transcriptional repressor ExuR n=1 Tax=Poriferisphaera corsica TaxID=2528020 RepID=A0A517YSV1_9BACT|nr:LacI family DNA-binding transcriptional regulator [Poriferisphaera corsica]QDU33232.1 putative HTH-type transcriptional repressor ExuR [Poriferisphaera corsica]